MSESKIIVDEDWKSQVQAEKQKLQEDAPPSQGAQAAGSTGRSSASSAIGDSDMPPASLPLLISMLATQAAICLGQMPNPMTDKMELHLSEARHFIDLLDVLEQKSNGNRTPEESEMLSTVLRELRLAFVYASSQPA